MNTLTGTFLWDDESLIVENERLDSLTGVLSFFNPHAWPSETRATFYRPVQLVTYALDKVIWGENSFGYHLGNILLHTAVAVMLYWFIYGAVRDRIAAFIGAAFFAIHPLHTEAIAYCSGRAEPLVAICMLFVVLSYALFLQHEQKGRRLFWLVMTALFYSVGLLSKEIAMISIVMTVLFTFCFNPSVKKGRVIGSVLLMSCITAGYVLLRLYNGGIIRFNIYNFSAIERIGVSIKAFALYAWLVVWPLGLHMERMLYPPASWHEWSFIAALIFSVLLIGGAWLLCAKSALKRFGIGWYMVALIPTLNIFSLNATFAEHWLYIPLIGLSMVLGSFCVGLGQLRWRRIVILVLCSGAVFFSVLTIMRNADWRDPIVLYKQTLTHRPLDIKIRYNLGTAYLKDDNAQAALTEFNEIVRIVKTKELKTAGPDADMLLRRLLTKTYNNMGNAYRMLSDFPHAVEAYHKALECNPAHELTLFNIGTAYHALGEKAKARAYYEQILAINAKHEKARTLYNVLQ